MVTDAMQDAVQGNDTSKCAHMRLGMASTCAYVTEGRGTLWEGTFWRCSNACKAEQRRRLGERP